MEHILTIEKATQETPLGPSKMRIARLHKEFYAV